MKRVQILQNHVQEQFYLHEEIVRTRNSLPEKQKQKTFTPNNCDLNRYLISTENAQNL